MDQDHLVNTEGAPGTGRIWTRTLVAAAGCVALSAALYAAPVAPAFADEAPDAPPGRRRGDG